MNQIVEEIKKYENELGLNLIIKINSSITNNICDKKYLKILESNCSLVKFITQYEHESIILNEYIANIKQLYENPYFDNFLDTEITRKDKDDELIVETLLDSYSNIDELLVDSEFLSDLKIKVGRVKEDKHILTKKIMKIHDFVVFALEYQHENGKGNNELENLIHFYEIGDFKQLLENIAYD